MSQNHKKIARRGSKPNPRKYRYLLMRIILVILQLLVIAGHSDKHRVNELGGERGDLCPARR